MIYILGFFEKRYKTLKEENDCLKKENGIFATKLKKQELLYNLIKTELTAERSGKHVLEEELNQFKQAYANEVQKRLSLTDKFMEEKKIMNNSHIKVKYHNKNIDKIKKIKKGNWIDLRAAETVELKAGEFAVISLGVSMKLPDGYEAYLVPRSSTFKKWGIIQTNSMGIIDNSYSGENDIWGMPVYAVRDTVINENDRICQFRIEKSMEEAEIEEVEHMEDENRGGFGSTGVD